MSEAEQVHIIKDTIDEIKNKLESLCGDVDDIIDTLDEVNDAAEYFTSPENIIRNALVAINEEEDTDFIQEEINLLFTTIEEKTKFQNKLLMLVLIITASVNKIGEK